MSQTLSRILMIAALSLVVVACDDSTEVDDTPTPSGTEDLGGSVSITESDVVGDQATISWSRSGAEGSEQWSVYRNNIVVCSGDSANATNSDDTSAGQNFSCDFTLQDGSNSIYVKFCQGSSCLSSATTIINYDEQQTDSSMPGDISLQDLASETIESQIQVSWIKPSGVNGDYWNIHHNGAHYCSGSLTYSSGSVEQSGGCMVNLESGVNQFQAELCINRPTGLADNCSQSEIGSTTFTPDASRMLATPVIVEPTEDLPAERDLSISWSKDTSSGTAGETASFYLNGVSACESTLDDGDTGASCELQLEEGDNMLQVSLCTNVATYSGDTCAQSELVTVTAYDPAPLPPGEMQITSSVLSKTYEESLLLQWSITSGNGVSDWMFFVNGSEHCATTSEQSYQTSGSCQIDLPVGANTIYVTGCNYGYDGDDSCVSSSDVYSERVAKPNQPTIETEFPATSEIREHELSWVGASDGGSAEYWLAQVNNITQCEIELTSTELPQSDSCTITAESGDNQIQVGLCVTDSLNSSYCAYSDIAHTELLAITPQTPEISTAAQLIHDDNITLAWSKPSGENAAYWLLSNNGAEVAACADQPILTTGDQQSGFCDLPLAIGDNAIVVSLCNVTTSSEACADSASVTIERDWASPSFSSADSVEAPENDTSVFYTVAASDNDSSAEQLSYSIAGADSSAFDFNTTSLELAFASPADYEQPGSFTSEPTYLLTFTATDETDLSGKLTLTVNLTNVNDNAPTFAPELASVAHDENDPISVDASASDADQDALEYALGGADSALFAIDASSGVIALDSTLGYDALDYEASQDADGDNVYELNVTAFDGISLVSQAIALSIVNTNDNAPQFSASPAELSVVENEDGIIYTAADFTSDADADTLTYSLQGADAAAFAIDSTSGELQFDPPPDYDNPSASGADPNLYSVDINASDGIYSALQSLSIAITAVDEAPVFASSSLALNLTENTTATSGDPTAEDPEGASVSYQLSDLASAENVHDAAYFTLSASGVLSFSDPNGPNHEDPQDYDADGTYLLLIAASDGTNSIDQQISVTVVNVNEAPAYAQPSATLAIDENRADVIHTSAASDPENDTLQYTLSGADANAFSLDSSSGELQFYPAPDYENPSSTGAANVYSIAITASDSEYQASESLTINVVNLNDSAPEFPSASASFTLDEHSTDAMVLQVSDPDDPEASQNLTYSIIGADAELFAVSAVNGGELSFKQAPDYETPLDLGGDRAGDNIYAIEVTASDSVNSSSQPIQIQVINLNDNPPAFAQSLLELSVDEETASAVHDVLATDADGDDLTYAVHTDASDDSSLFSISSSSGALFFNLPPDYEDTQDANADNVYELNVTASDGVSTSHQSLEIEVVNINDNPPSFATTSSAVDVQENTSATFYDADATDADGDDSLSYSLSVTDDQQYFAIDPTSGALSFASPPDFEEPLGVSGNTYQIQIIASDSANSATLDLDITVTDYNDEFPQLTSEESVFRNLSDFTSTAVLVHTVTAEDRDAADQQLSYVLSGTDADQFTLDSSSGELYFTEAPSDYRVYDLETQISDTANNTSTFALTVTVADDVGDPPTFSVASASVDFAENSSDLQVYDADATDPDEDDGDTITYSLKATDDAAFFTIDATTGVVSFLATPDYETILDADQDNTYDLSVQARDAIGHVVELSLAVHVTNVNDNSPAFASSSATASVPEGTSAVVYDANATDADVDDILTYSLGGAQSAYFDLDSASGELSFQQAPDFEDQAAQDLANVYQVEIIAADADSSATLQLSITVTDINEAHYFESSSSSLSLSENNTSSLTLPAATDPDLSNTIAYELIALAAGNDDYSYFTLTSASGAAPSIAFVNPGADYENISDHNSDYIYEFLLHAYDADHSNITHQVSIAITNLNDNPPVFEDVDSSPVALSVDENVATSYLVYDANASDADADDNPNLSYSLGGNDSAYFAIGSGDGKLNFSASPDHEAPGRSNIYQIEIYATTNSDVATLELSITVEDINEAPAFDSADATNLQLFENDTSSLALPVATDPDANNAVSYSLISHNSTSDYQYFALDTSSATPSIAFNDPALITQVGADYENPQDADGDQTYQFILRASDGSLNTDLAITVAIQNINEAPVSTETDFAISFEEHSTDTVHTASDYVSDPENATLQYSLDGADKDYFAINSSSGMVAFNQAPDFENPFGDNSDNIYDISVIASDGSNSIAQLLTIEIINLNETPYFPEDSTTSYTLAENDSSSIELTEAVDPDSDRVAINYSLAAAGNNAQDYQLFELSSGPKIASADAEGIDYEIVYDYDYNGIYTFTVRATDSADSSLSADLVITVEIENVDEAPKFEENPLRVYFDESATGVVHVVQGTAVDPDDDAAEISYTVSGTDIGEFDYDSASGELSFKEVPNFEAPNDANGDNVYDLSVTATDSSQSTTQSLFVEINDLDDEPPSAPTGFVAYSGEDQILLIWDVLDTVDSYTIFQSTDASTLTTVNFDKEYENLSSGELTVTGLLEGVTYHFIIAGRNSWGLGETTAVLSATPRLFISACPYPNSATATSSDTSDSNSLDCTCSGITTNPWFGKDSTVAFSCSGTERTITGNSIPDHATGTFADIVTVEAIYTHTTTPTFTREEDEAIAVPGVVRNGIRLEPGTGESYRGSGEWNYEAIGGILDQGLDSSNGHLDASGIYHYHGMPEGYLDLTNINDGLDMILVGWADDGFPIYARYGKSDSGVKVMQSSYQLLDEDYLNNTLNRPTSDSQRDFDSLPLGTFTEDWAYVAGSGDLDQCNGRYGSTPQFPNGVYHYYITDQFPYIQRCLKGDDGLVFTSGDEVEVEENTAIVYQAVATDNLGTSITYSLNSAKASDNNLFTIGSSSGALSFVDDTFPANTTFSINTNVPDYEALPTGDLGHDPYINPYIIEIAAEDASGSTAEIQVQLTILDVNESPYLTSDHDDQEHVANNIGTIYNDDGSFNLDGSAGRRVYYELEQEANGEDIPFFSGISPRPNFIDHEDQLVNQNKPLHDAELTGTDADFFYIESISTNGAVEISFRITPDEDYPEDANGDNIYELNVVGIDSEGNRNEQPYTVEVIFQLDEHPYLISSSQSAFSDSDNSGRLYFEVNLSAYSTAVFFTAEAYDEDLFQDLTGATDDIIRNQTEKYFELSGESADEQFFEIDIESGELRATKSLAPDTPQDEDGDGVYELQIIVSDRDPNGSEQDLEYLLDNTFYPEDVKPRWIYVTVEAAVNEATPAVSSGPQIPWFYSDVHTGDSINIPWVIYSGSGASEWKLYVDDALVCEGLGGESANDVTDRGVCEVDGSLLTAGKTDHTAYVRVFYPDSTSEDSYPITFGYAISDSITPVGPTSSSKDADDCQDVDIGDPVNASQNSDCYNYLLSDDSFGGPYDAVPPYLTSDYGRGFDVIAYFTEWAIYGRDVQPADMPVNLLSTALYSFIQFTGDNNKIECEDCDIDGTVDLADPYASLQKTYETDVWRDINADWTATNADGRLGNGIFKQLWLLKQKFPHFKTCLTVGGWTFSRPFPLVGASSSKRQAFAESIVDMAVKYHFDCIDIDWEFPGTAGGDLVATNPDTGKATYDLDFDGNSAFIDPSEDDAEYFEDLIQALRDEIDARPVEASHIEINSAVFTSSAGMALMNYSNFADNLDAIHLMTYDYYGAWDPFTGFQAALYHNTDPVGADMALAGYGGSYNPQHNIASAMVRAVNNAMGENDSNGVFGADLPNAEANARMRRKIVPGLAFYGRNYSDVGFFAGGDDPIAGKHMVLAFGVGSEKNSTVQLGWERGNLNYVQIPGYYDDGEQVLGSEDYNATAEMVVGQDENGDDIIEVLTFNTADYNWTYHWDSESQSPFLFDPNGKNSLGEPTGSFISYTDPRAIYYQTCHAAWENSKGVMFWEITQDSTDFQLIDAIHTAIKGENLANRGYDDVPSCSDIIDSDHYSGGSSHVGDSDEPGIVGLVEMGYINEDIFNNLFPHANGDTSTTEQTYTWDGFYQAAQEFTEDGFLDVGSIEDRVRELAAFLANTSHETGISSGGYALNNIGGDTAGSTRYDGGYFYQQEQYCTVGEGTGSSACQYCLYGAGYDFACDWLNGVDQEPAHYSNYYYGRGPLQLSWNYNYGQFGDYYGTNFLGDPNAVLKDSKTAFASAMWFWMTVQDPKPSMHQVMTDPDYDGDYTGHAPGFGMTINILNGGLECGSAFAYDKVRNRVGFYLTYLNAFSAFHGEGISPWVNGYGSTPATSLDFPTDDEHLIDDDYPDARDYLSCSQMINYNDI